MFLAISHNTGDPTPYLEAEGARVAELQKAGLLEQLLLKADRSGVVLLLRAADLVTARDAVDSLPLAANGIANFELIEVTTVDGTS